MLDSLRKAEKLWKGNTDLKFNTWSLQARRGQKVLQEEVRDAEKYHPKVAVELFWEDLLCVLKHGAYPLQASCAIRVAGPVYPY